MTRPREAQLELLLTISEGLSRGSHEMLRVSPTDAMHAPSCGLAIRDAVEELRWMRAEIERLRATLRWYADPRNHFPVERRSPGAPDPAVIFVEEPQIMIDGGKRAREALEVKP